MRICSREHSLQCIDLGAFCIYGTKPTRHVVTVHLRGKHVQPHTRMVQYSAVQYSEKRLSLLVSWRVNGMSSGHKHT